MPRYRQPPFVATDEQRRMVRAMISGGITQAEIGAYFEITDRTIRKHFKTELQQGYVNVKTRIAGRLIAAADAGDVKAMIFYLETHGWTKTSNVALSNAEDAPLAVSFRWADATPAETEPPASEPQAT